MDPQFEFAGFAVILFARMSQYFDTLLAQLRLGRRKDLGIRGLGLRRLGLVFLRS